MKRYIAIGCFSVALMPSLETNAAWLGKGIYLNLTGGYSQTSGKLKPETGFKIGNDTIGDVVEKNDNKAGFLTMLALGHKASFGKGHFSGELTVSYDTSKAQVGQLDATAANATWGTVANTSYKLMYEPRFGVGVGARAGFYFTPSVLGYIRLGVDFNFGKVILNAPKKKHYDSIKVWYLSPGVGLEGQLNDKTSWVAAFDYKFAFSVSKYNQTSQFLNKPKTYVFRAGISYHF